MLTPTRGLYQQLITEALAAELARLNAANDGAAALTPDASPQARLRVVQQPLDKAEVADRLALHMAGVVERALAGIRDSERLEQGVTTIRRLIDLLGECSGQELDGDRPHPDAIMLEAILARQMDGNDETITSPHVPLLDSTLLTNAPGEPTIGSALTSEIDSADRIDVIMAFIRLSGLRPMLPALERFCQRASGKLRVLTTTYTGTTESNALDQLTSIGAEIKLSYDISQTRLHAKSWLFHRDSGFSTAFVGSSNLTHSAQCPGLEWNVRVSTARNRAIVEKIAAVFESYWHEGEFVDYDADSFIDTLARQRQTNTPQALLSPLEIHLHPFQEHLLEQIAVARSQGQHRNLLVSATGTGKTVMAAVDYRRFRQRQRSSRLLFIAHRQEILTQSVATFRHALRQSDFGELWVDGQKPVHFNHVFASIQGLSRVALADIDQMHFDMVIVDEFHHASAASYTRLIDHLKPTELLGLTATPERADGESILHWFGGRITAELRLWDAIDQYRLVPFLYYGIADETNLSEIPWKRGIGYDLGELSTLYTGNDVAARHVLHQLEAHVEIDSSRILGFCISVEHARFMARHFCAAGIQAEALWGETSGQDRKRALQALESGDIRCIFSVDLFNEGLDIPSVDTLLLLRPTDSATLFLQQLGRGLRRHAEKRFCTVLDFIGQHRREFRFDTRLRALLGGTRHDVERQLKAGFPYLPAGCHLSLDRVASERVLTSLRQALPSNWRAMQRELTALAGTLERLPTLTEFLDETGLELEDVYANPRCWSDLIESAPVASIDASHGPHEKTLRRALGRLLHAMDAERLDAWLACCGEAIHDTSAVSTDAIRQVAESPRFARLVNMLSATLFTSLSKATKPDTPQACIALLRKHPVVCRELGELLPRLKQCQDHAFVPVTTHEAVPLQVHACYTRVEMLAALGESAGAIVPSWREGVRHVEPARVDLLAFTLNKTEKHFSPTTRYRDYAISRQLIHWESQSGTPADSPVGQRYQHHEMQGSAIWLFARVNSGDAFRFLGPAHYVSHHGERPMAITWRLVHPLPGDLFEAYGVAVA